jgi:molecular chaperone IbpA
MTRLDLSPFRAMTVGFDSLFNDIADFRPSSYPPHNIEKVGDCEYKLTFAVAGFSEKDISVTQKENTLSIEGQQNSTDKEYLYKGIAERTFNQSFKLSEYMNVKDAKLKDGMLNILLVQDLPKEKQPKQIKIN